MNTKLHPAPHRPPLIQIKYKKFMMLNCKYVYPLIFTKNDKLNLDNSSDLSRVNFLTAPYYHENDIYNVYVSYMSERRAKQMISSIKEYYNLECDAIKMLREDMEYYSEIMNTPLVVIRNHKPENDIYELSYKDKKRFNVI